MYSSFFLLSMFLSFGYSGNSEKFPPMDSLIVYCDFNKMGYTTNAARNHFYDLRKLNIKTKILSNEDCQRLESILSGIKPRRHYQEKFGIDNVFFECYLKDRISVHGCVIGKGEGSYAFTDLTANVEFFIKQSDDVKYIADLLERLRCSAGN